MWSIYMVRRNDGKIYTGISTDVAKRFEMHQNSNSQGAKFLRGMGPLELLIQMEVGEQKLAMNVEHKVKKLAKDKKEEIVNDPSILRILIDIETSISNTMPKRNAEGPRA